MASRHTDGDTEIFDGVSLPLLLLRGSEGELRVDVSPDQSLVVGLEKGPSRFGLHTTRYDTLVACHDHVTNIHTIQ